MQHAADEQVLVATMTGMMQAVSSLQAGLSHSRAAVSSPRSPLWHVRSVLPAHHLQDHRHHSAGELAMLPAAFTQDYFPPAIGCELHVLDSQAQRPQWLLTKQSSLLLKTTSWSSQQTSAISTLMFTSTACQKQGVTGMYSYDLLMHLLTCWQFSV